MTDRSSQDWKELYKRFEIANIPEECKKEILLVIKDKIAFAKRVERFGAKTANLQELEQLGLKVPPFIGLESNEIEKIISKEIETLWNKFVDVQGTNQSKLTEESKIILKKIRQTIKKCAEKNLITSNKLSQFLDEHKNSELAVRSTGKEDSDQLANPGGNKSVNSVAPTLSSINKACGVVLASYFSEKSFEQRIAAGDDILATPFMPVLIQVMVGEQLGGAADIKDIPASGVLFTVETEGNTPTHALAQVSFGHGEAVVDNQAPSDTFYISDKDIASKIHNKDYRRVAFESVNGRSMKSVSNPKSLRRKACLSNQQLNELRKAGKLIHKHYGKVMDIEFVYDRLGDNLYIVQARPLQQQKRQKEASFIRLPENYPSENISQGDVIVVAGGEIKKLDCKSCIIASTLDQALHQYLEREDKKSVQIVLCQSKAESTSHAAGVFRSVSIPVLRVNDVSSWEKKLKLNDNGLYACTQSGRLISWQMNNTIPVEKGWFSHPVGKHFSWENKFTDEQVTELSKYWAEKVSRHKGKSMKSEPLLPKNLAFISNPEKVLVRLVSKLYHFQQKEKKFQKRFSTLFSNILNVAKNCIESKPNSMERLFYTSQLESIIKQETGSELVSSDSYKTTVSEIHHEKKIKHQTNLRDIKIDRRPWVIELLKLKQVLLRKQLGNMWNDFVIEVASLGSDEELASLVLLVFKLQKAKLTDVWLNTNFPQALIKAKGFRDRLTILNDDKDLSNALNWIEDRNKPLMKWKQKIDQWVEPKAFEKLFSEFKKEMDVTSELMDRLGTNDGLNRLALLKFYEQYLEVYDLTLKSLCDSPLYCGEESLLAGRFASLLEPFAQMSSTLIEFAEKNYPERFPKNERNLTPYSVTYQNILKKQLALAKIYSQSDISAITEQSTQLFNLWKALFDRRVLQGTESKVQSYPVQAHEELHKVINKQPDSIQLKKLINEQAKGLIEVPRNFSVASANIFSSTLFTRHLPPNLAASYTLAHQNQLSVIGFMFQAEGLSETKLPNTIKPFILGMNEAMKKMNRDGTRVDLVSVDYHYPKMVISYNLPLRNHSSSLTLTMNLNNQEMTISQKMFGHNLSGRMDNTVEAASLFAGMGINGLLFTEPPHYDPKGHEFSYELKIPLRETTPDQRQLLGNIAYSLTGFGWMSRRFDFLDQVGLKKDDPKVAFLARKSLFYAIYMSSKIGTEDWLPEDIRLLTKSSRINTQQKNLNQFLINHISSLWFWVNRINNKKDGWDNSTEWTTPKKFMIAIDSITDFILEYDTKKFTELECVYYQLANNSNFSNLFKDWFKEKCKTHPILVWNFINMKNDWFEGIETNRSYSPALLKKAYEKILNKILNTDVIPKETEELVDKLIKSTNKISNQNFAYVELIKKYLFPYIEKNKRAIIKKLLICNPIIAEKLLSHIVMEKKISQDELSIFFTDWISMVLKNYLTENKESILYKCYVDSDSYISQKLRQHFDDCKPGDVFRTTYLDYISKKIYLHRDIARSDSVNSYAKLSEKEAKKYQFPQPIPLISGACLINNLVKKSTSNDVAILPELIKQWAPFVLEADKEEIMALKVFSQLLKRISSVLKKHSKDPEIDALRKKLLDIGLFSE